MIPTASTIKESESMWSQSKAPLDIYEDQSHSSNVKTVSENESDSALTSKFT